MFASRQAFRFARRAANHLGQHQCAANNSVAGGMFSQNCFMSTAVGRAVPGVQNGLEALAEGMGKEVVATPLEALLAADVVATEVQINCCNTFSGISHPAGGAGP